MDTFTVYAEDGEYSEQAQSIEQALAQFRQRRPGLFVAAVVNDGMRPRLILEGPVLASLERTSPQVRSDAIEWLYGFVL